ncbi:MAG: DUF2934 domain-containing protein [Pseudomonadota bacterium]
MNDRTNRNAADAGHALADRVLKGDAIKSGAVTARAVRSRTGKRPRVTQPPSNSIVTRSSAYLEPEQRKAMIAESAYFRSAHREFEPGHEVDDWLASEVEIDAALARGDLPRFVE